MRVLTLVAALALLALAAPGAQAACVGNVACASAGTNLAPFIDQLCVWADVMVLGFTHGQMACTVDPCPEWLCARQVDGLAAVHLP